MTTDTPSASRANMRRVAISSYLGTTLEYYDFMLFGTAAALVFNKIFFTDLPPVLGTILSLGTLAAGYVARFLGAIVFGHLGDKRGRKKILLVTLCVMGVSSGLIGCLPDYGQIGVAAPIILVVLRLIQGFAIGGEFGGAVLMTSEHATSKRRGLASSAAAMGGPSGALLAMAVMLPVAAMPEDDLLSWGWRVPFLASFGFLAVALYFRLRITESPVFLMEKDDLDKSNPLQELWRFHRGPLVKSILFQVGAYTGQGVFGVFVISYAPTIGYARSTALTAVLTGTAIAIVLTPLYAMISDRFGRRPVLAVGIGAAALMAFPVFALINMQNPTIFIVAVSFYTVFVLAPVTSVAPVYLTELFPTRMRYTGVSTSYQLAQILGAGLAPVTAASLIAASGGGKNTGFVALYVVVLCLIGLVALALSREQRGSLVSDSIAPVADPVSPTPPLAGETSIKQSPVAAGPEQ